MRLNDTARDQIKYSTDYRMTAREFSILLSDSPFWAGDRCGCLDDRCSGFHHEPEQECGCLPVMIEQATRAQATSEPTTTEAYAVNALVDEMNETRKELADTIYAIKCGNFHENGAVFLASQIVIQANDLLDHTVEAARGAGMTWERVGEQMGISRQAAHERWKD